jgi:hypothetical protein
MTHSTSGQEGLGVHLLLVGHTSISNRRLQPRRGADFVNQAQSACGWHFGEAQRI